MKKISEERFEKLVKTKLYKGKWDAYITWDGLDMYELADTEYSAKQQLFSIINYGDSNILWRGKSPSMPRIAEPYN